MKQKIFSYLIILLTFITCIILFLIGCSNKKTENTNTNKNNNKDNKIILKENYYYPYTGEKCDKKAKDADAFMAVIENSKDARPQSGLSEADVIFETMAEGGIPRFIAIFQKNSPICIGPIRSVRPYFISLSKEYNLPFAHCGGSSEALDIIDKENLMSLNEMKYGAFFYRDNSRKAPHNLYTTSDKIKELLKSKNYNVKFNKITFDSEYFSKLKGEIASSITISPNKYYTTSYEYKDGLYFKSMDGIKSIDKNNNSEISVKNIVIQLTNITLQNDNNHIDVPLIGKGEGYIISSGKYEKINWYRNDINSMTVLKNLNGDTVNLNVGNTIWHIIDNNSKISIK